MTNQNFRVKNGLEVGNNIKIDSGSGIITATKFVGDGSGLTNVSGGGGGTSDFVRTSAGIHTLGNVGIGTTVVTSIVNIGSPSIGSTSNYIITYGNFDVEQYRGIGTYSAVHTDFVTDGNNNTYIVGGFDDAYYGGGLYFPAKGFIAKINSSKQLEWDYSLESTNADYNKSSKICGICSATNGDVVVAYETYYFQGSNYEPLGANSLSYIKFNSSGVIQWQQTINNINLEYSGISDYNTRPLKVFLYSDNSGNIYSSGKALIDGSIRSFINKLDSSGNIVFSKILYNILGQKGFIFKGSNLYWIGTVSSSGTKVRVVKLDLNGDIVWDKWFNPINSSGDPTNFFKVTIDDSENIYFFTRVSNWGLGDSGYGHGYIVEKYNSSFVRQWTKRIHTNTLRSASYGSLHAYPNSIDVDSSGNVYIIGTNINYKSRHAFGYDIFKLNSSGNLVWKRFLSAPSIIEENGYDVINDLRRTTISKIEIKNNSLLFTADVSTPSNTKNTFFNKSNNPDLSWIGKNTSDSISTLVASLDLDGNCIGVYGGYSVEELEIVRDGIYVLPRSPVGVISDFSYTDGEPTYFFNVVSNVGIGTTVGVSTFTTSSISLSTIPTRNLLGEPTFQTWITNEPALKFDNRQFFNLNVSGTTKLSKLIVGDIEFGGQSSALHTIAIGYSSGFYNHSDRSTSSECSAKYNTFIGSYAAASIFGGGPFQYNNFIGYRAGAYSASSLCNNFFGKAAGNYTRGCNNNFFGTYAGYANGWGECNVFIGKYAGAWATGSESSVMIGDGAGAFGGGYGGWGHIFIGRYAGAYATTLNSYTDANIFIGIGAGCCGTGNYNNFFGYYTGATNVTGGCNNFFGYCNGYSNQTGYYNNFFGSWTGHYNNTGNYNNFFGSVAGYYNSIGNRNIYLGSYSGISTSSSNKVIIGSGYNWSNFFDSPDTTKDIQFAVGMNTDGNGNKYWLVGNENFNVGIGTTNPSTKLHVEGTVTATAFVGDGSGLTNVSGGGGGTTYWVSNDAGIHTTSNVGVGTTNPITKLQINGTLGFGTVFGYAYSSTNVLIGDETTGSSLTPQATNSWTGLNNILIGSGTGAATTTGNSNIFMGMNAGRSNTSGYYNSFFGLYAGCSNTTGNTNIFIGNYTTGINNTTGSLNNFIGYGAGQFNTVGSCNNFIGYYAGKCNTTGDRNIFIGTYSGTDNTSGNQNVFVGGFSGYSNLGGSSNSFFGHKSGYFNLGGACNSFFGFYSGGGNTTGKLNVYLGFYSGIYATTSSYNSFLGSYSGSNITGTASSIIAIGHAAGYNAGGIKNIFIGSYSGNSINGGNNSIYLGGFSGIDTGSYKVVIGQGGNKWGDPNSEVFDTPSPKKDYQLAIGVRTDANPSKYWLVGDENFNIGIGTTNPGPGIKLDVLGGEIRAGRVDASSEGGQVSFSRASDNLTAWYLDVYGNTSTPSLRFVDVSNSAVRAEINGSGNFIIGGDAKVGVDTSKGVVLTSPNGTQYRLVVDNSGNLTTTLV